MTYIGEPQKEIISTPETEPVPEIIPLPDRSPTTPTPVPDREKIPA